MRWLALQLILSGGLVFADERQAVKPRTSVEVLDDKAPIDDVISRLKQKREQKPAPPPSSQGLREERPPLPKEPPEAQKKTPKNDKASAERWRRPHHERGNAPERTERPGRERH